MSEPTQVPPAETRVVNLYHLPEGWESDKNHIYIGREGRGHNGYFCNPYHIGTDGGLAVVLERFRTYAVGRIRADPDFRIQVTSLLGKTLVCFCAPREGLTSSNGLQCHGQILAILAEGLNSDSKYLLGD